MFAEFKHTLRRMRGQIIGWGIGLGLYALMMAMMYSSVAQIEDMQAYLAQFPEEMMAFFSSITEIATPAGYMDTYFFSMMTLIVGILAISAGAGLIASDEEKGILDLVLAHPVSRSRLFWGRLLALVAALALTLLVGWLGWVLPSGSAGMDVDGLGFLLPFLPLFAQLFLFGSLALLLSMLLPAGRLAGVATGTLLVANYLLLGMANMNDALQPVVKLTPLYYYQGGLAVHGLNWTWLGALLGAALLLALAAWALFRRRDIRVGGERSWHLPRPARHPGRGLKRAAKAG